MTQRSLDDANRPRKRTRLDTHTNTDTGLPKIVNAVLGRDLYKIISFSRDFQAQQGREPTMGDINKKLAREYKRAQKRL